MRLTKTALVLLCLSIGFAGAASAQDYPFPAKTPDTAVTCPATICPTYPGYPTQPYSAPISSFVGRFVDSHRTRDYQTGPRTLRAGSVKAHPTKDRVYVMLGEGLAAYQKSTWFASGLAQPMARVSRPKQVNETPGETHSPYLYWLYPEKASEWRTPLVDGQQRLYGFDFDDRGNILLAYSVFGWAIVTDNGSAFSLVKQSMDAIEGIEPKASVAFRTENRHFALIGDLKTGFNVFDVTNAAQPAHVRTVFRKSDWLQYARTAYSTGMLVAYGDTKKVMVYRAETLASGGSPELELNPSEVGGKSFGGITSDGTNVFVAVNGSTLKLLKITPSLSRETFETGTVISSLTMGDGDGYISAIGTADSALFRVENGVPKFVDINHYIQNYYYIAPAGKAIPANYMVSRDQRVISYGGRDYLIHSAHGIGDVYELRGRDIVTLGFDAASPGEINPNSPPSTGIYYGDPIRFTSGFPAAFKPRILWDFDNSENPTSPLETAAGQPLTYQYAGVTSLAGVTKSRTVTITDTLDPTDTAKVSLTMKAPEVRAKVNAQLFTAAGTTTAPILLGDEWNDASDGTLDGHYSVWTLDQTSTALAPSASLPVGSCGQHTLSLAARYVPYSIGAAAPIPVPTLPESSHYVKSLGPITYDVRPFVAQANVASSTTTEITFRSGIRFSSAAFVQGELTVATVRWELVGGDPAVPVKVQEQTMALSTSAGNTFTVPKELIAATGSEIRLTVTVAPESVDPASACVNYSLVTSTYALRVADPKLVTDGCGNVGSPCSFTISSFSGAPTAEWTVAWKLDGVPVAATGLVFDATSLITESKSYTITADVSNLSTSGAIALTTAIRPDPPLCSGKPTEVVVWATGCSSCKIGDPIKMNLSAWGYTWQDCDYVVWEFGDGTASVTKQNPFDFPTHAYTKNGTFTVKATVKNSAGANVVGTTTVQIGDSTPPPPPPPTCGSFPAASSVGITGRGSSPSCDGTNPSCSSTEAVSFGPDVTYSFQACDTFAWNFGDGGTSTSRYPSHVFSTPGTYTVTMIWSKPTGSLTKTKQFVITAGSGGGCPTTAPGALVDFAYLGAQSKCSGAGGNCVANEQITFTATSFNYTYQACDSFSWNFGDGSTATGKVVSHAYASASANPEVTLTVTNTKGSSTARAVVQFGSSGTCPTPVPSIASSRTASVGVPVNFAGSVQPADATVSTWEWNFGDSKSGTGQNVPHTFTTAGNYTVTLRVVLSCGNSAITTFNINVTNGKSFSYLIPVVSHITNSDGSSWRTDLQIFSEDPTISTSPMTLQAKFSGITHGMTKDLVVGSSTFVREDFQKFFVPDGDEYGSVILTGTAAKEPQIWTRLYRLDATGLGSYGQLIPAIRLDDQPAAQIGPSRFYLPGLLSTPSYRTNIGLVNPNSAKVDLKLIAYDDLGTPLMEFAQSLLPYQMQQINDLAQRINEKLTGKRDPQLARPYMVVIENPAGTQIIAYHSTVDNISNDPIFVEAVPEESVLQSYNKEQILPGVGHIGSWKSDMTIYNPGDKIQVDIEYFENSGKKAAEVTNYWLDAKEEKVIADVLFAGLMNPAPTADSTGFIKVTTKTDIGTVRHPVIEARTYNDRGALGTFGQGIRAFALSHANVTATRDAFIAGVRKDLSYYTNIGLVNLGAEPARIQIVMLDRLDGHEIAGGTWERITQTINEKGETVWVPAPLAPNESLIVSDIFKATGTTAERASVRIRMLSGTSAWAYASIVDQTTKDPEYVPAVPASK